MLIPEKYGLADIIVEIAGIQIVKTHVPGPQGVRGRDSDNTHPCQILGWEPEISLEEGLARTFEWIEEQVRLKLIGKRDVLSERIGFERGNNCPDISYSINQRMGQFSPT